MPQGRLWIIGPWRDLALFVLPAVWIIPLMWFLKNRFDVNAFGVTLLAVGSVGHHLPGFIRAYTDPVLFRRYRLRFIFAPVFFLIACMIFSIYNLQSLKFILLLWGAWHGAMQINGFLRIYDSRVKSISPVTAWMDWAMCLTWFGGGLLHSPTRMIAVFSYYYGAAGPLIPPQGFFFFRQSWDVLILFTTLAFLANAWRRTRAGNPPNPVKFLLMASSFSFWWFAMVKVDNLLLGLLLFEIFHDIQYNALVWVYNQRRVSQHMAASSVERFLFQPNAWRIVFYGLLILGYGYFGVLTDYVSVQAPNTLHAGFGTAGFWTGLFIVSAFLHFYFDGFIWRVREAEFQQGLGMGKRSAGPVFPVPSVPRRLMPGWKWSFFVIPAVLLGVSEYRGGAKPLLDQFRNMAQLIPDSWQANFVLALMEKSNGEYDRALEHCEKVVAINPDFETAHAMAADIYFLNLGQPDQALGHYFRAVNLDPADYEAQDHLGTLLLTLGRVDEAIPHLQIAAQHEPDDTNLAYLLKAALTRNRMERP